MTEVAEMPILFVEDDADFLADLLRLWHPAGQVRCTPTIEQALVGLAESCPALVVLDLCLPSAESQGLGLLEIIRRERGPRLPVIVLTRCDSPDIRRRALELGANAYLTKPVDIAEFDATVRHLLCAA